MKAIRALMSFAIALLFFITPAATFIHAAALPPAQSYDVVVYGGTASGAMAAIAVAKAGLKVALLEPGRHIGGMVSGGLSRTDFDSQQHVIGGMAREFFERVGKHYQQPITWIFEPHVAERIFNDWLKEAGVKVFFNHRVDTARKEGKRISSLTMENGTVFSAKMFIDASYEGDLLPRAGVSYTVGREGQSQYGESLAGRREEAPFGGKQFIVPVPTHDDNNQLLPLVYGGDSGKVGEGDKKVQAYNFRICLTTRKENQIPFPRPANYDPKRYELLKRYLTDGVRQGLHLRSLICISKIPNDKNDVNDCGAIATNMIGENWEYPEANYQKRQEIWDRHLNYIQGFFYFLAHDASVPKTIQEEMNKYGLAKDEFVDTEHWPHQLYVREARRMIGEYVMTQTDLQEQRTKYDSIGMGGYNIDSMPVQRIPVLMHKFPKAYYVAVNEGYLTVPVKPYQIAYRALLPRYQECENLLVPVALSASHVAYSSIRMEPQYMILGHSAGLAATLAARADVPVQKINVSQLQAELRQQNQILALEDKR